ncbi:hypothetical protein AB1Y20_020784 [Prymnesium parvum]|uniref:CAF1B/HIR1 beta-propeller domain-containing protein n=1 Tax=Prymnesium parvum TaxID=97485 RepID=A0AB34JY71_PRYPA
MSVRVATPQISWHGREPVLSVDVAVRHNLLATGGSDGDVRLWRVNKQSARADELVSFVQELSGHTKPVNAVRFSPNGETLASAGDDGLIMLWQQRTRDSQVSRARLVQTYMQAPSLPLPTSKTTGTRTPTQPRTCHAHADPPDAQPTWVAIGALRGHCADVYDLCWSPDAECLFSGGVDGSSIVWNVAKCKPHQTFRDHEHYVQGVAWDPQGTHLVSLSCDRTARVYASAPPKKAGDLRVFSPLHVLSKRSQLPPPAAGEANRAPSPIGGATGSAAPSAADESPTGATQLSPPAPGVDAPADPSAAETQPKDTKEKEAATQEKARAGPSRARQETKGVNCRLFLDDTVGSFFRRPSWSPDGSFVILPCGQIVELPACPTDSSTAVETLKEKDGNAKPTSFVLSRYSLGAPCAHLPGPTKPVIATRCCPRLFELVAEGEEAAMAGWMDLPYRVVWAVATIDAVIMYDSQHQEPLLAASNIHLAAISDIAWLPTGDGLIVSSMDGYCTLILLQSENALGTPLPPDRWPDCMLPKSVPAATEPAAMPPPSTLAATANPNLSQATPASAPSTGSFEGGEAAEKVRALERAEPERALAAGDGERVEASGGAEAAKDELQTASPREDHASIAPENGPDSVEPHAQKNETVDGAAEPMKKKPRRVTPVFVSTL